MARPQDSLDGKRVEMSGLGTTVLSEKLSDFSVAVVEGQSQGSKTTGILGIDVGAMRQKESNHVEATRLDSLVQRCLPQRAERIKVGTLGNQKFCERNITISRSEVKRHRPVG